jgi:hypothetical protein
MFNVEKFNNSEEKMQSNRGIKQVCASALLCGQHRKVYDIEAELVGQKAPTLYAFVTSGTLD